MVRHSNEADLVRLSNVQARASLHKAGVEHLHHLLGGIMAEQEEGAASARPQEGLSEDDKASDAADDNVTLSFLDKLKCMMYSKVERDAFLIEKLEKEEKKKGMRTKALSLHQQGWSWTKIATELGCHRTTVMRLVHKWQQTGCISDLPHRRRPRSHHHHHHHQHHHQQQLHLAQLHSLSNNNNNSNSTSVSSRLSSSHPLRSHWQEENRKMPSSTSRNTTITVRRRLKELRAQLGIQSPPSPELPIIPSSDAKANLPHNTRTPVPSVEKQQKKPLRTLQEISSFTPEEIGYLVFSDMKIFLSDKEGGVRVWRLGQPPLDSYNGLQDFFQKGGLSATFWVCISGSGKKGHFLHIPNELTEERYVQILHNGLLPSAAAIFGLNAHRFLFAQDRASIQASPVVEDFLCQQQVQCAEWPSRSAELNPCDLLWSEVEQCIATSRQPRNVLELVQMVREGYESVDSEYIQWLVSPIRIRSLCQRMMKVDTTQTALSSQGSSEVNGHDGSNQ